MFDETDIQWSCEVGHTNLHNKIISKIVKKILKNELHHDGVGLVVESWT